MAVEFRHQFDGKLIAPRVFHQLEQIDMVERAGYRSTQQMVEALMRAGQNLVAFRATEFSGDLNPGPFQGAPDVVDLDARMDEVVQSGEKAAGRVAESSKAAREAARQAKIQEARELLKEVSSEAPSQGGEPT